MSEPKDKTIPKECRRPVMAGMAILAVILLATILYSQLFFTREPSEADREQAAVSMEGEQQASRSRDRTDASEPRRANRLVHETSPYLLQHAHNPVHWYPWGPEAFQRAKREGKLIFLSVGYSTCYWCHVMERESFENDEVAEILNEHYIAIKVDREERPDIDEQYMLASQLLTGRGGWPNSVWLTPDGKPWMAGTYFPRERFKEILLTVAELWQTRREDVQSQAERLSAAIQQAGTVNASAAGERSLNQQLIDNAVSMLKQSFDAEHGGFGIAPKFPPHDRLLLLAHEYRRSRDTALLRMLTTTLDAMARGGIHDHLAGGFHRYSTDQSWLLPHFEKMLYDNAQLLRAYTDAYSLTENEMYREVVQDIVSWVSREMTDSGGAFYSAIDAESEQEEGKFYVWSRDEVLGILSEQQGSLFATVYGVKRDGNYVDQATGHRPGTNVLQLPKPLDEVARESGIDAGTLKRDLDAMRQKLLAARSERIRPHLDDKILSGWNGLMIGSLAYSGRQLEEPSYIDAAAQAAQFVLSTMTEDGRLLRTYRAGKARLPGYLDDYAFFIAGLLDLHEATGNRQWLDRATQLTDVMLKGFQDRENGGFYFTTPEHEDLLMRSKNILGGGNIPSGNGVAADVLFRLGHMKDEAIYHQAAEDTLRAFSDLMWRDPTATETLILTTARTLSAAEATSQQDSVATNPISASPAEASSGVSRRVEGPVTMEIFASRHAVTPGQQVHVAVVIDTESPWHLYGSNPDAKFVTPTEVVVRPHPALHVDDSVVPRAQRTDDPVLGQALATYEGRITFLVPITLRDDAALGPLLLEIEIHTQACDSHRCLAPITTKLQLPLMVQSRATENASLHRDIFEPFDIGD